MENYAMRRKKSKDFLTLHNCLPIKLLAVVVYVFREIARTLARRPEPCLYGRSEIACMMRNRTPDLWS
jgi:hypothetical protein